MAEYLVEWSGRFSARVHASNEEDAEEYALDLIRFNPDDYLMFGWFHEDTELIEED